MLLTINKIGNLENILNEIDKDRIIDHRIKSNFFLPASNPLLYISTNLKAANTSLRPKDHVDNRDIQ